MVGRVRRTQCGLHPEHGDDVTRDLAAGVLLLTGDEATVADGKRLE
jgi:hypothetical protein